MVRCIARLSAHLLAASLIASVAQADTCFDESDEARSLLTRRRLLEARARLRVCAASSCDEPVRVLCDERLAEVGARLPTIIFDVKDPAGHDLSNVALSVDGAAYADGGQGAEITLDPGRHVFRFEVENLASLELTFVLAEREKGRREHVVLGSVDGQRAPVIAPVADRPAQVSESASLWRTAAWITLGAGAVGLGIGTAFGIVAITKNGDANCDAHDVCTDPRSRHDARIAANVSTAGVVIGGALAGAAVAVLVFGPKTTKRSGVSNVTVGTVGSGGSLILAGQW